MTLKLSTVEIEKLNWVAFQHVLTSILKDRFRLVSFFSCPGGEHSIFINAVLLGKGTGLRFLRAELKRDSFPSFTKEYPFFHCFEREIFEQTGIKPSGHPWLKPVRFPKSTQHSYPFFKMEGKEIHEVGVGPIHAGVIEPGHFRFMCYGETVHHLEIHLGYQHRGAEQLLLERDLKQLGPIVETIAGDSSIAYAWAYSKAVEELCGLEMPETVDQVRGIALELERIAMHLAGLAGISTDIAFLPGSSTYGRLRTSIINTSMRICGSRFGRCWIRPGGVCFGFSSELSEEVIETLLKFQRDIGIINDLFQSSTFVKHRLQKTGILTTETAGDIGVVGPAARASSLGIDLRQNFAVAPYQARPIQIITETSGDCWARSFVRIREIEASTNWILSVLREFPNLEAQLFPLGDPQPNTIVVSTVEGWRGEVFHCLETTDNGTLLHYRIQDPSLRNWFALAQVVRGGAISDFPICNKSFDLSYCGHDL